MPAFSLARTAFFFVRVLIAVFVLAVSGFAHAEQFVATPTREVGPHVTGQTNPAPGGGWQASDDRILGASVIGQQGWTGTCSNQNYDQEITAGIAHSGGHGWRLSNWYHNGCVNHVISPAYAPVGELGSTTVINGAGVGPSTSSVVYEFWFRTSSTPPEPGTFTSTTITDQAGRRMTYLGFFDEAASAGNGCPGDGACFHLDASGVTDGGIAGDDDSVVFDDNYSPALNRGQWYRVHIDATFNDTTGSSTRRNDVVNYALYDANGGLVWAANGVNTWEDAYYQGHYGSNPGDKVASSYIAYRISSNPDSGSQSDGDSYAVSQRPHGIVFDDLKVTPGNSQPGYATSFDYDRYVATSGSDVGDCSNPAAPCRTITYAIAQSNPYDTVHVTAGKYAENSAAGQNLIIAKPVAIEGAQSGVDARTRNAGDVNETIIVPSLVDAGLTLNSLGDVAVVQINSAGVSLDGLIIDGDNSSLTSPITLNGANPDADSGIFASGSGITVQNVVIRNLGGSGILAFMDSGAGGDNAIAHDRFTNISNPSTWGIGIYAGSNFYAQITDNLFDQVRVGVQTENDNAPNPGAQAPTVARNEIHATRNAMFHNLFYQSASTYTLADNRLFAAAAPAQTGQWNGLVIESFQDAQTVVISGNQVDGGALAGSGRTRAAYLLNNVVSSAAASTAIDGGSVSHVDVGVLSTDASFYSGPVNDFVATNIAFNDVALGAFYVEDTLEQAGSAHLTIGDGNTYTASVGHRLVLSGAAPTAGFGGSQTGISDVLVRSARNFYFGNTGSGFGPCNPTPCTVSNASINAAIGMADPGAAVYIEQGTFDEMAIVGSGKDGVRLSAADANNPPTLTRLSGGPDQPVLVVAGTPLGAPGAAPKNVSVDHLHFVVDKVHAAEGLLANGYVDGLSIHDNQFVQSASSTVGTASYKYTNAISINIDPQHNSLGLPRVDGSNVWIQNNTITGSSAPNTTKFRAGIAMDAGVGTIANNISAGLNHDAIVRFATTVAGGSNGVFITANTFNGGGLEFDAPNAGIAPVVISGNTITAAAGSPALGLTQSQLEADISVLRLIDNYQRLPVTVTGNTFAGYANGYRGALVENFPNTTFTGNTFTPLAGAADFVSLVVSNKEINTDNPAEPPYPMSITALSNTFNGSGTGNTGRAVEFINDNDANGTAAFNALLFGSSLPADANIFDANHQLYFNLVDQTCDTRVPPGNAPQCTFLDYNDVGSLQNTQVRPFRGNVYAVNNLFGGIAPGAMLAPQQAQLNLQTNDIRDNPALGYVNYGFSGIVLMVKGPVANVPTRVPTAYLGELNNTGSALPETAVMHLVLTSDRAGGGIQAGDIAAEYDAGGGNYLPLPLTMVGNTLVADYGTPGFAVPAVFNLTTLFRFTYTYANGTAGTNYTAAAHLVGMNTHIVYAADTHTTNVVQLPASIGLALAGPQLATAGAPASAYSARLTNTGGATTENVLVHFSISRTGGIGAGDLSLQYFDGSNYQAIVLTPCNGNTQLCGTFGPQPGGFPVGVAYDATTALHASYVRSGLFTVNASVDGVITAMQYTSTSLIVTVAAGAATTIAASGPTTFSGIAGATLPATPAVIVTDANGNPVPGFAVSFAPGSNSGSLSGASPLTDVNGIATLGGWTLGTAATETVSATAAVANGNPVVFTTTVSAQLDVAINMSDSREFVQFGRTLNYVIVVTNAGPSTATSVQVTDTLPPEVDGANASWICFHSIGASCSASGSGNLADAANIPSGGSATYVLSATVLNDQNLSSDTIVNMATISTAGDGNNANDTATSTTQGVIFRDGFEPGGDGAQSAPASPWLVAAFDASTTLTLDPVHAPQAGSMPATWLRASDAQGRGVFRIESVRDGNNVLVRIVSSDENGGESFSAWTPLAAQSAGLALADTSATRAVILLGADSGNLQAAIPSWAALPLKVYSPQ